jgi:hypothetical protein
LADERTMGAWGAKRRKRPTQLTAPAGDQMESVRRSSSLPSGVFKRIDAKVEQALTGPVADVFLSHMTAPPLPVVQQQRPKVAPIAGNSVSQEEIGAFMSAYSDAAGAAKPEVTLGLSSERMWVLTDLATHGSGRARELATRELRDLVRAMSVAEFSDVDLLRRLVRTIEQRDSAESISVLLQVLLASAREALRNLEGRA